MLLAATGLFFRTKGSAVSKDPHAALCQLKSCQLLYE